MPRRITLTSAAVLLLLGVWGLIGSVPADAQARREAGWTGRTSWGDPDLQGEWTSEGEYGVPFERPAQFGSRAFLTDAEYAKRLDDVRARDERDLARVDVLAGKVEGETLTLAYSSPTGNGTFRWQALPGGGFSGEFWDELTQAGGPSTLVPAP